VLQVGDPNYNRILFGLCWLRMDELFLNLDCISIVYISLVHCWWGNIIGTASNASPQTTAQREEADRLLMCTGSNQFIS
jgi:hypothetical protein